MATRKRNGPILLALRLIALTLSVALVLGAAELGIRFYGSPPWYELLPKERQPSYRYAYEVGRKKFVVRHPPLNLPKLKGSQRILFLGDSFTYGSGVKESETFAFQTTEKLNKKANGPFYESFNGGVPASMTTDWVELFDEVAESFQPDWVVVVFFLRDGVEGVTSIGQINAIRSQMAKLSEDSILYRNSRLWRYFVDREAQRKLSTEYLGRLESGYLGAPEETQEWERAQENLQYIRSESNRLRAEFLMVIFPVLFELGEEYPLESAIQEIIRFAEEEQMTNLSLLPAFRGRSAFELWVSPLDQHPNAEGHAIAANAIFEFLTQQYQL